MNESSCICICFAKLYFFYWLSVVSLHFSSLCRLFSVVHEHRLQEYSKCRPYQTLLKITHRLFIQTLNSSQLAGRIGDFGFFFYGFDKSPRLFRSSWLLNECNFYFKIDKYYILSEVCMMKTAPHGTVSPQMWCIKSIKGWFTRPRFVSKIL